jgi:hypothetical protein
MILATVVLAALSLAVILSPAEDEGSPAEGR